MNEELLKKLAESDRLSKIDALMSPEVDPIANESAYEQLKSLRLQDDYDTDLKDKLMAMALRNRAKNMPQE
jgi:hypothetical protein